MTDATRSPLSPMWKPSQERLANTRLSAFESRVRTEYDIPGDGYEGLHDWSIDKVTLSGRKLPGSSICRGNGMAWFQGRATM